MLRGRGGLWGEKKKKGHTRYSTRGVLAAGRKRRGLFVKERYTAASAEDSQEKGFWVGRNTPLVWAGGGMPGVGLATEGGGGGEMGEDEGDPDE